MQPNFYPEPEGLYDPEFEHDSCGVGFVAHLKGQTSHMIVQKGLELLKNLEHRGATGAEKNSGDGAGILTQLPNRFMQKAALDAGITLPPRGEYGVGAIFLPRDPEAYIECKSIIEQCVAEAGQKTLGWRRLPTNRAPLGETVQAVEPYAYHVFIQKADELDLDAFERKLYVIRKQAQTLITQSPIQGTGYYYAPSFSSQTIVYKGQFTTEQLPVYFSDLSDPYFESALALVHSRFSTNTFPSWPLAQPFRYLAHNGEINTLRGNINWMRARQDMLHSELFTPEELEKIYPYLINEKKGSDSSVLDNVVELLTLAGRPLHHVMMMMIPAAWNDDGEMDPKLKAFYEYHATFMEPWDGPASVAFTDGKKIGAILDRNGLRPSRYCLTSDDLLVMASEQGALEFPPENVVLKGRLQPGKMFLADLEEGRIIPDSELKQSLASAYDYPQWVAEHKIDLDDLPLKNDIVQPNHATILQRQKCYGYTQEDLKMILTPMANEAYEATGSMGNDAPLAVLSNRSVNLYNYFHQLFAQVTNPPIDPIREESVMSLSSYIGPQGNLFQQVDENRKFIKLSTPILTNEQLEKLRGIDEMAFHAITIPILFDANKPGSLESSLEKVLDKAEEAVREGHQVLILSTRGIGKSTAPIPTLLATSAVHHRLIRAGIRTNCGLVVETGEAREIHHFATLIGYGANAINPYLAFETIEDMRKRHLIDPTIDHDRAVANTIKAIGKGILKVMSKMGISTIRSYAGAQIFEAVGLSEELIERYFPGTPSRLGGIGLTEIEEESLIYHRAAYPKEPMEDNDLFVGGQYAYRQRGEKHLTNPEMIHLLQRASRENCRDSYREFSRIINEPSSALTLRHLLEFTKAESISIDEVESSESIMTRFATGAMSFGSISEEAHTTLAIAMNRIGGKSNTGEGGEDAARFGTEKNSKIKQVASGRFGVTANYLVHAEEIQIKMAQGAKPGEGGQLPGHKVDATIGKTRHSTPGVGLISPPPHHDIYSIEDLKQLIYDLKNANTEARINVKLVSEVGVGTVAAGVAKAKADVVLISGWDGGTGASPQTSIKHAGLPWELGLAETHQTLVKNGLRSRIVVQTDGQLRTGRDLAIATLLGAEEWGIATSALIVEGCILMRKCHLNTCPVGIATQDERLRKKYTGKPEHVINYVRFMVEELREIMAELGFRTIDEMVGRVDKLTPKPDIAHWKAQHLKLDRLLHSMHLRSSDDSHCSSCQDHELEQVLDRQMVRLADTAITNGTPMQQEIQLKNIHRTVGTILSSTLTRQRGEQGLADDTISFKATGSAGQSFGAFLNSGITLEIEGDANDYFGKGLCGGKLILYPPKNATYAPQENVILGNVSFYGATSGRAYIHGLAGERFCVRNSGAEVVVDAIGDHGCEYMTGGRVVILGDIGKNFAAGMSGGIAYIYDPDNRLKSRINTGMVELERIEEAEESRLIHVLITEHARTTGSRQSERIAAAWEEEKTHFIKVMPIDYKRVLARLPRRKDEQDVDASA